jgi:hypothetical protein
LAYADLGGDIAMKLAANRPDRVDKLSDQHPAFEELPARTYSNAAADGEVAFSLTRV